MILGVEDLAVTFRAGERVIPAVDKVSLSVKRGEAVALVGESGCGKSVSAMALTRLPPTDTAACEGDIIFDAALLNTHADFARIRGRGIAYVFQEAQSSLNPVMRIGEQLTEITGRGRTGRTRALALLGEVELKQPVSVFKAYPCELSGGMQQRVVMAMALACEAQLVVADEPTTALDVTTQARVLHLLRKVSVTPQSALLLITHNLGLVAEYADRVYVMYAGHVVEQGRVCDVLLSPAHPYTRGLLKAVPRLATERADSLQGIPGRVPAPDQRPQGCRFANRCSSCKAACRTDAVELKTFKEGERAVRCLFPLISE